MRALAWVRPLTQQKWRVAIVKECSHGKLGWHKTLAGCGLLAAVIDSWPGLIMRLARVCFGENKMKTTVMSGEKFAELMGEIQRLKNENEKLKKENDKLQIALEEYDREQMQW
jgi:hypothetical protein